MGDRMTCISCDKECRDDPSGLCGICLLVERLDRRMWENLERRFGPEADQAVKELIESIEGVTLK